MTNLSADRSHEMRKTVADLVIVPLVLAWFIFSNGPLVSLATGGLAPMRLGLNVFFLLTGFWGLLGGYFLMRAMMWKGTSPQGGGINRTYLGAYAGVWCVLYFIFIYMPR
jgi:hypothetical protein